MNSAEKVCDLVLYPEPAFDKGLRGLCDDGSKLHLTTPSYLLTSGLQKTPRDYSLIPELENAFMKRGHIVTND